MASYTATFSTAETVTRTSHNEYTHAWAVIANGDVFRYGFSGSRTLAEKAAVSCRSRWITEDPDERLRRAKTPAARKYVTESIERMGGKEAVKARRMVEMESYKIEIAEAVLA